MDEYEPVLPDPDLADGAPDWGLVALAGGVGFTLAAALAAWWASR